MTVVYAKETDLTADEFIDALNRSGLAARRPVRDIDRVQRMLHGADLTISARDTDRGNELVGVARSITDFAYCCYLSDIAVDTAYQGRGIGGRLIEESRRLAGGECSFFLISAPQAVPFYERLDMPRISNVFGWMVPPQNRKSGHS